MGSPARRQGVTSSRGGGSGGVDRRSVFRTVWGGAWTAGRRFGVAAALVALALLPVHVVESGPVVCPVRLFTAGECPGCGITRAVSLALHGDLGHAIEANAGVVLVLPALALLAFLQLRAALSR